MIEPSGNGNHPREFMPDSFEQIEDSIKRLGPLWDQLCHAFQAAIARVNDRQRELDRPAIDEAGECNPKDETL